MNRFKDKHVLVTGAGTGIGKGIALRLAKEGAHVSVVSRAKERLSETVSEIQASGGKALLYTADICSNEQIGQAVEKAAQELGPLYAVVANSGAGGPNSPDEDDRFLELVQTNLVGTYQTLRAAQKYMLNQTDRARHMVVISSCLARFGVVESLANFLSLLVLLRKEINIILNFCCVLHQITS